jgi:Ca2+-binding RTX toxin-like protein
VATRVISKRFFAFLAGMALVLGLGVPFMPSAQAGHPANSCLDLSPEQATNPTGTTHTVTATLRQDGTGTSPCDSDEPAVATPRVLPVTVNFEITGPNDPDSSNSPASPDRQCTIEITASSCQMPPYTGTLIGTDVIRGFISDAGADTTEARDESAFPGTTPEPDDTDVVEKTWVAGPPSRLDCDDQNGDDRETNPSNAGSASDEPYTCKVTDAQGNPTRDPDSTNGNTSESVVVKGENESANVNDPDPPGSQGATYATPDYQCSPNASGQCTITVTQLRQETGSADICFYIDQTPSTSTESEGADLCAAEPTDETEANDAADQVTKTWAPPTTAPTVSTRLDCVPESDTNPTRTSHTITCTATQPNGDLVQTASIDVEATGANDPDNSNSPTTPDFTCTTAADNPDTQTNEKGVCSFTHGPSGVGTTNNSGTTTYRAWVDYNNNNGNSEADTAEGPNEQTEPGTTGEPDGTDVVQKIWISDPNKLEMSPDSDTATVGECNPFTITVTDVENKPVPNATIDVEQQHQEVEDAQPFDEPTVSFCVPSSGPNPSNVDTSRGDLSPPSETPDNQGTAGGETTTTTDSNGQVTIGIRVSAAQGSNGAGDVDVIAFYDKDSNGDGTVEDNDDPDQGDPKDTSIKSWVAPAGPGGRAIDCEPEASTTDTSATRTVTCVVTNSSGQPQQGVSVSFTEDGPGQFTTPSQVTTDDQGRASVTVASDESGTQTITGTITNSFQSEPDTDECDRAANDPQGAQQGVCSDSVTNTWESEPEEPQCDDGVDNDGDGEIDHPDDPGCENPNDDDETDPAPEDKCPGYENAPGTHLVGTEGPDVLVGTEDDDIICGLGGDDQIDGLGGDDVITGGSGDDAIDGGDGADEIRGQGGDDTVFGDEGNDGIIGGSGEDELSGNRGHDTLLGGGDDDILRGHVGTDFASGGAGNDRVNGGSSRDNLEGGRGNDAIKGGLGDDFINGGRGRDRCKGGAGKDEIRSCEGASSAARRRHY